MNRYGVWTAQNECLHPTCCYHPAQPSSCSKRRLCQNVGMSESGTPQKSAPVLLQQNNYLALVRGSVNANLFRHIFATVGDARHDLTQDGRLSCAFFVSCILTLMRRIDAPHATVSGTVRAMEAAGWELVEAAPKEGDVLVWEPKASEDGTSHPHIGFSLGDDLAISNSPDERTPVEHHWTYGASNGVPVRAIEAIYRYSRSAT